MADLLGKSETITADDWISNESEYLQQLQSMPSLTEIPLLNSNALHNLVDGTLVRFRGMIQDMHNPEFYFEKFEIFNSNTNTITTKSGKYRDTSSVGEHEKLNYTTNLNCGQRQTMVVISLPGLNEWAQNIENKENTLSRLENLPNSSKRSSIEVISLKRPLEEDENEMEVNDTEITEKQRSKELKTEENNTDPGMVVSREHILNFPLPDIQSMSCIVKTYDDSAGLKLNDMIEVVGFLSVDPSLSGEFSTNEVSALEAHDDIMDAENITHNPPPSLVPRIHAVWVKKLDHCNPLVKEPIDQDSVLKDAEDARQYLKKALTELLLGDELAAEYLICHLISCVYLRQETISLGQLTLNISNIPTHPNYTKQLYDIIKQFVTKSYYLPMTLENMNTMTFLPKKDYNCNRLTSGILQLSKNTHLVIDETKLEQGTLDSTGVANVAALGNLIQHQKVEYDFKYYKMDFESDIQVLILSEGKSLLPCELHLPLKPEESSLAIFKEIVEAATYYLKDEIMNKIRVYLTNIKRVDYTINEDLKFVQDDFIAMRNPNDGSAPATADDLHRLLVLARLLSLSKGLNTLDKNIWDLTKQMEKERLFRANNRLNL